MSLLHHANLLLSEPMQTTNSVAAKNVQRHRITTTCYCWMSTILISSTCLSVWIVDSDSSNRNCLVMKTVVIIFGFLSVSMKNVALITRTSLVDPYGKHHCLRTFLCVFVLLFMVSFLGFIAYQFTTIQDHHGHDESEPDLLCFVAFTLREPLTFIFVEVILSGVSLVLFIPSLWNPSRSESKDEYRKLATRVLTSQIISVMVTVVIGTIIINENKFIPIRRASLLICCDAAAGCLLFACTWKTTFYRRIALDLLSRMNLVVGDSNMKDSKACDSSNDRKCAGLVLAPQDSRSRLKSSSILSISTSVLGKAGISPVNSSRVSSQSVAAIRKENSISPDQLLERKCDFGTSRHPASRHV